jgi:hypothetical protein
MLAKEYLVKLVQGQRLIMLSKEVQNVEVLN